MYKFVKRTFDIIASFTALLALSPLFFILCTLVAVFNGMPVFFKQPRPGKNGKIFMLYKFRSMSNKKDENGYLLPDKDRITGFGKLLRRSSLDELPQLINILKGDMSLIGPRPRMIEECLFLNENQKDRFKVRPGITGLAQINGRNNITFDKVVEFDKQYVENLSLKQDVQIFFKTISYVLKRRDINKVGTVSNEFYGDYLLRTNKVSKEEYQEKKFIANQITKLVMNKNDKNNKINRNVLVVNKDTDLDLEHKIID